MIIEKACQFGFGGHLQGVLTLPPTRNEDLPAILLLSAGLLHKIGPNRLHPILARKMSEMGVSTLRFDMQGIGDSDSPSARGTLQDQTRESIRAAMDLVTEETGIKEFVLGGLCSGAEDGFATAVDDDRVVGLILLDPHGYPTTMYQIHRFFYRIRRKPLKMLGWYLKRDETKESGSSEAVQRFGYIDIPEQQYVIDSLKKMVKRKVKMLYIYSGSWEYFNHRKQFFTMFKDVDFENHASIYHFKNQDHTATLRSDQDRLVSVIQSWFSKAVLNL